MLKRSIKYFLRKKGYQINKIPSLQNDIKNGKYIWLQNMGIGTVLDIGANVGKFSKMISQILGNVNIYAFEPLNSCFEELTKNTRFIENIKCFNFGLGENQEETTMYHNEFSPSSSLLKMKELHKEVFPQTASSFSEDIQIKNLDEFADEILLYPRVLMKIDVQGFELQVLRGARASLKKIDAIIVETSFVKLYENQPLFDDIYRFLVEMNYSYQGNFGQLENPKTGHILQADAIFVRK